MELQTLLISYRDGLKEKRELQPHEVVDLQWILDRPPEKRLIDLRCQSDWDRVMEVNKVYHRSEGQRVPGPNSARLPQYEACRPEILSSQMRIVSRGDVIPYDSAHGAQLDLPPENSVLSSQELEGRKTYLFSIPFCAKEARLRAIDLLAASGAALTEIEKVDRDYLRALTPK